jgi:hypothetical protein
MPIRPEERKYYGPHRLLNLAHLSHDAADASPAAGGSCGLTEELRLAPFPMRTWPARLRQLDLFENS